MRMKFVSLLAAVVLSKFIVPAAAQVPEVGMLGLPSGNPPMAVKARVVCENTDIFGPDRWFTWCFGSPDMRDRWVEFIANQGPIAKVLGLPVPAAHDAGGASSRTTLSWADASSHACRSVRATGSPYKGPGAGTLFDFWPHTECPVGNAVGLSSTYSDLTAAARGAPGCTTNGRAINFPGGQFPPAWVSVI